MILSYQFATHLLKPEFPQDGGLTPRIFRRLADKFPEIVTVKDTLIEKTWVSDFSDCQKIISFLAKLGVPPPRDRAALAKPYFLTIKRIYDADDIVSSPLLQPFGKKEIAGMCRDESGKVLLRRETLMGFAQYGHLSPYGGMLAVRSEGKVALETAGLKRITFQLMEARNDPKLDKKPGWPSAPPVWMVSSDLTLPPIKNLCFDNRGNIFSSTDSSGSHPFGCFPLEGHIRNVELHYQSFQIANLPEFDIAWTFERFGNSEAGLHELVVSQKFREVVTDLGYETAFHPVRIGEDSSIPLGPQIES